MATDIEFNAKTTGFGRFKRNVTAAALHVKRRFRDATNGISKRGGFLKGLLGKTAGTNLLLGLGMATMAFRQLGAVVSGAFVQLRQMAQQFDQIAKSARRTGVSFENFQKLTFVAQITGATFENVERTFRTFQQRLGDIKLGNVAKLNHLVKELKIDTDALSKMDPFTAFTTVFGEINKIGNFNQKSAVAQAFGGRGGTQTLPLIENFKKIADIFETLDLQIEEQVLAGAEDLDDQFVILGLQIKKIISEFGLLEVAAQQMRKANIAVLIARGKFGEDHLYGDVIDWKGALQGAVDVGLGGAFGPVLLDFFRDINKNAKGAQEGLIAQLDPKKKKGEGAIGAIEAGFGTSRSAFNNMGGFMTAGMRASGITQDPVLTELQKISGLLTDIKTMEPMTDSFKSDMLHPQHPRKHMTFPGGNNK